jgi:hypothetical protein
MPLWAIIGLSIFTWYALAGLFGRILATNEDEVNKFFVWLFSPLIFASFVLSLGYVKLWKATEI